MTVMEGDGSSGTDGALAPSLTYMTHGTHMTHAGTNGAWPPWRIPNTPGRCSSLISGMVRAHWCDGPSSFVGWTELIRGTAHMIASTISGRCSSMKRVEKTNSLYSWVWVRSCAPVIISGMGRAH